MNKLSDRDYIDAAQELGCEVAAVKAVADVESSGDAFLPTGEPKILFEAHHFSRLTDHKYDITYPRLSSAKWNKKLYIGGIGEHRRLQQAVILNKEAALQSASWGMFQIMGYNWKTCGYDSIQSFVNDMYSSSGQLKAFIKFIENNPRLLTALRKKNWIKFAENYNGPRYMENRYDVKLEQAYKRFLH